MKKTTIRTTLLAGLLAGALASGAHAQINGVNDNIISANLNNSGYYTLPTITGLGGDLTVEGWVYLSSYANWGRIADIGNGENSGNILLTTSGTSGKPLFSVRSGSTELGTIEGATALGTNTWVHVAGVIQSDRTMRLYVNGTQVAVGAASGDVPVVNRTSNYIGKSNWSADSLLNGAVADIRIWNTARTQAEIQNNMDVGSITGATTGLVAAYPFGDTGSAPTSDVSGNGYTATQSGNITYSKFDTGTLTTGGFSGNSTSVNAAAGTLNLTGTNSVKNVTVNTATISQSSGTVTTTQGGDGAFQVGVSAGQTGIYELSGGSVNVNGNGNIQIGATGTGTMNQTGGNLTGTEWVVFGRYTGSNGTYNISGGTLNQSDSATKILVGEEAKGALNISGNAVVTSAGGVGIGWGNTGNGTVNLNGGTLVTKDISKGTGTGSFNFNGGTLQASGNSTTFMTGLTSASIQGGGGTINDGGYAITIGQAFSGNGALTKTGAGTTTLTGSNTYSGGTIINSGTLSIGSGGTTGSLGTGAVTNNASLVFDQYTTAYTINNTISGTGAVTKRGGNTLTYTAGNTFAGNYTQKGGVTVLNRNGGAALFADGSTGNLVIGNELGGATYWYSAVETARANQLGSNVNVTFNPSNITSGYSYLVLKGNDQTIGNLSSPNSYASSWAVVENQETGSFGNSRITVTQSQDGTFKGEFRNGYGTSVGTLGLTKNGSATLTLTSAGGVGISYTGTTIINGGTLKLADATGFASATTINAGGTLELANTGSQTISATISGAGSLVKSAAGNATLSAQNSYTGGTTVNAGTLTLNDAVNNGNSVIVGDLTVNSGGTVNLTGSGAALGWNTSRVSGLTINGGLVSAAGKEHIWQMAGGVNMTGGELRSNGGTSSNTTGNYFEWGNTTVTTSASANSATISGRINVRDDASPTLSFNVADGAAASDLNVSAAITPSGANAVGVVKNGAGAMTFTGNNTYTGGTTVNAGTLAIGTGGILANNAANTLTINNGGTFTIARTDFLGTHTATINMPIVVNSGGVLQNSGAVFNSLGALTLNGGTLQANAVDVTSGQSFALKGAVTVNGSTTSTIAGNGIALGAAGVTGTTFVVNDGAAATDLNVTGVLRDGAGNTWPTTQASSLTKNGTGKMVIAGDNTYTGVTTINSGTLALDKTAGGQLYKTGSYFGQAGAVTVNTGGTFQSWNWGYGANNALSELQENYTAFVVNGGKVVVDDTFASARAFTVGANGATLETTAGNTYTKSANTNEFNLIRFSANSTLTVAGDGNAVINDALGSFGNTGFGITKNGTGTLTLGGSSSYTGATTINTGTLATSGNDRIATSNSVTVNAAGNFALGGNQTLASVTGSGTIQLGDYILSTGASNSTYSGTIAGNGGLTKSGAGTFTLSGVGSFSGDTNITGGTLILASASALSSDAVVLMNAGTTLTVNQRTFIGALEQGGGTVNGPGSLVATLTLTNNGSLNAVLADGPDYAAGILKRTSGTTTIGAANTFTGAIKIQGGTLQLSGNGSFDAASSLVMSAGATMDLNNKSQTFSAVTGQGGTVAIGSGSLTVNNATSDDYNGVITGTGSLTKSGAGTLTLGGNNTYSGGTTVSGGKLAGTTTSLKGAITNNAQVEFAQGTDGTYTGNMGGSGALIKSGSGTVTLTGSNTHSGGTTISGGKLVAGTANLQGNLANNGAFEIAQNTTGTYAGDITGSGSFTKSGTGTVTLSGTNSYAGGTTVSGGKLVGNTSSLKGQVTNNAAVEFAQNSTGTYLGAMEGTGTLTKSGAGKLVMSGTSTYTGATTVEAGQLTVNGALASTATVQSGASIGGSGRVGGLILNSGSTLTPGNSPGTFSVTGDATWNGGANYNWQVYSPNTDPAVQTAAGTGWDYIDVNGTLTLGLDSTNRFNLNLWSLSGTGPDTNGTIPGWNPNVGSTWLIASAAGGINLDGVTLAANTNYSSLFNINTAAFNGTGGWSGALPSSFEVVTLGDANALYLQAVAGSAAVPEPGQVAASLLLLAGIGGYVFLKRRKSAKSAVAIG